MTNDEMTSTEWALDEYRGDLKRLLKELNGADELRDLSSLGHRLEHLAWRMVDTGDKAHA